MLRQIVLPQSRMCRGFCAQLAAITLNAKSLADTKGLCKIIATYLKGGDVVQLIGKVGAGKTELARFMIRSMLNNEDEVVQSPTFSLALSYKCSRSLHLRVFLLDNIRSACTNPTYKEIHHIDAYRLIRFSDKTGVKQRLIHILGLTRTA